MQRATQTILITGATDGIGLALARHYAAQGERPFLLGRRPLTELDDSLFTHETYCHLDLRRSDCATQVTEFLEARHVNWLDLLVHNAGTGYYGRSATQSAASINEIIDVNLLAPIRLTHALLPYLEKARGQLAFVSSVVSVLPGPDYAVYTATKAGLEGFARNLRQELQAQVKVQVIRPGATRTGMHEKMGIDRTEIDWEKFSPPDKVAQAIARQIDRKRPWSTIGVGNQLLRLIGENFPHAVEWALKRDHEPTTEAEGEEAATDTPVCAITGAASGIGRALALRFAQAGYQIIGIDRNVERASETEADLRGVGVEASFIIADLGTPQGIERTVQALGEQPDPDVFIHNAGINEVGRFQDSSLARQERVLDVNLRAPLQLTAALLHNGLLKPSGSLVFISSLSRYVGYPGAAVYAASKDAVAAYARSLRVDLAPNRNVLTVYPGPTRTAHARRHSPDNSRESRRMPPEDLADAVFAAVEERRSRLVPGWNNRLFALLGQLWPRLAEWGMRRMILDKLDVRGNTV